LVLRPLLGLVDGSRSRSLLSVAAGAAAFGFGLRWPACGVVHEPGSRLLFMCRYRVRGGGATLGLGVCFGAQCLVRLSVGSPAVGCRVLRVAARVDVGCEGFWGTVIGAGGVRGSLCRVGCSLSGGGLPGCCGCLLWCGGSRLCLM